MKRLPLLEEPPPPLPPARRSWGWWRCGAAGSGEGQSGHRRQLRRGPAPARRAGGRAGARAPRPARVPAAALGCQRAGPCRSGTRRWVPGGVPGVCLRPGGAPEPPAYPTAAPLFCVPALVARTSSSAARDPGSRALGKLARGGRGAPLAEAGGQGARERPAGAGAGAGWVLQLSPSAGPVPHPGAPSAKERVASSQPPVPAALSRRSGASVALAVTRPLHSGPLSGALFRAGSAGPMKRAVGPLRNAFSDRVLESKAPGAPPDCGLRGRGPRAEPQAPLGDRARSPHSAPELLPCPGGAFLPCIYHPEERRALGVRPEPASSALAAPGQPRDSARWMLCVAEAKLKVSGMWAKVP